ncbi:hypothetical protein M885DRAFT_508599 [Pelagophyceae sp. CCMP2097]|nr:hypothetical protein M885DRAFT_508599 [Pelagophyceae sp. CCMP2097]
MLRGSGKVTAQRPKEEAASPTSPTAAEPFIQEAAPAVWRKLPRAPNPQEFWGGIPGSGCAVSVVASPGGFEFEVRARVDVHVVALLDVVEADNTFKAQLRVALEWEVQEAQWAGCVDFWTREYVPRLKLLFKNGETRFNVLDADHADGPDEIGTELVNAQGETLRFFRLQRRVTETFRQTFDLRAFPFDMQRLAIELEAEPTVVLGRTYNLVLEHPGGQSGSEGHHVICENADRVDDAAFETLYALDGAELAGPGERRRNEYVVLLFVSRNFRSTLWNLIVPTLFIEFLSFLTYWVNPCQLADRAAVTVTLFLTAVSFKTYTADKLPAVPYLTSVENYLMVCFLILALQALLLILAAKFCNPDGIEGQVVPDRYRKHDGVDQYWSEDVRTRLQNTVDSAALILTFIMIVGSFLVYIVGDFLRLERRCAKVHRMKAAAESLGHAQFSDFAFIASRFTPLATVAGLVDRRTAPLRKRSIFRSASVLPADAVGDADAAGGAPEAPPLPRGTTTKAAAEARAKARYRTAIDFFRLQQTTPTVGYENPRIAARFTGARAHRPPALAPAERAGAADRAAIIDAGTGETKLLIASYIDNGPDEPPDVVLKDHSTFTLPGEEKSPLLGLCRDGDTAPFETWLLGTLRPVLCVDVQALLAQQSGKELLRLLARQDAAEDADLALEHRRLALDAALGFEIRVAPASKRLFYVHDKVKGVRDAENAALKKDMACRSLNGKGFSEKLLCAQLQRCAAILDHGCAHVSLEVGDRVAVAAARPLRYAVARGGEPMLVSRDTAATFAVWPGAKGTVSAVLGVDLVEVAWDEPQGGVAATVVHRYDRSDAGLFGSLCALAECQLTFALFADAENDEWRELKLVLGTGAWFRHADAATRAPFLEMVSRLEKHFQHCEMICLTALDEAHCEDLSIQYAHQCVKRDLPDASLAVGNGSTQLVAIEAPVVGADVEFEDAAGLKRFATVLTREKEFFYTPKDHHRFTYVYSLRLRGGGAADAEADGAAAHAPGVVVDGIVLRHVRLNVAARGWGKVPKAPHLIALGNTRGIDTFRDCTRTVDELQAVWRSDATTHVAQAIRDQEIPAGAFHSVCAISACFYAATAAGLEVSKEGPTMVTVRDARRKFEDKLEEMLRLCREAKKKNPNLTPWEILGLKAHKGFPMNLSNITYQLVLCELLFDDDTEMHFCRNWIIQGKEFRTTWSSGWFLDFLVRSKSILRAATPQGIHKGFCGLI